MDTPVFDYAADGIQSAKPLTHSAGLYKPFEQGLQVRLLLLLIFASTVAVFAYQADKFLDLRYTLRPLESDPKHMPRWSGWDFAIDCVCLIVTLVPFTMMSYSFDGKLMSRAGIIPFFLAYILLLFLSLALLLFVRLKYLLSLQYYDAAPSQAAQAEEGRYSSLTFHWFVVNGITIILLMLYFGALRSGSYLCHTSMRGPGAWFIAVFTAAALLRNYADFTTVWPFLLMNNSEVSVAGLPRLSRWYMRWAGSQQFNQGLTLADLIMWLILLAVALLVCPQILNSLTLLGTCA